MKKIKDYFNEILQDRTTWDYYNGLGWKYTEIDSLLKNSNEFIKEYLSLGGKMDSNLPTKYFEVLNKDSLRSKHTLSIFLFGLLLYDKLKVIKSKTDRFLEVVERNIDHYAEITPFAYYWFLICFFHDLGYSFEKYDIKDLFSDMKNINKKFLIKGLPLYPSGFTSCRDAFKFNKSIDNVIPNNIKLSWRHYFMYRYIEANEIEHGILGGLLFFTDRSNQYYREKEQYNQDSFVDKDGLFWSETILYNIHLPIAWIILAHNMWFIDEQDDNVSVYKEYDLEKMIVQKPVISTRYPLLLLLSLVDTLDPIKLSMKKEIDIDYILNNIELDFDCNKISFKKTDVLNIIFDFNNLKKIELWLRVKVTQSHDTIDIVILD